MPKSSEKTIQRINTDDVEVRYSHIIKVLTDWIDTTNLITSAGRGMAKVLLYRPDALPIVFMICQVRRLLLQLIPTRI